MKMNSVAAEVAQGSKAFMTCFFEAEVGVLLAYFAGCRVLME
jgi:hypothetical protein